MTQSHSPCWLMPISFDVEAELFASWYVSSTFEPERRVDGSVAPSETLVLLYPRHTAELPIAPTSVHVRLGPHVSPSAYCNLNFSDPAVEVAFVTFSPMRRRRTPPGPGVNGDGIESFSLRSFAPLGHGSVGVIAFLFAYQRKANWLYKGPLTTCSEPSESVGGGHENFLFCTGPIMFVSSPAASVSRSSL